MAPKPSLPWQAVTLLVCETALICACYLAGLYWAGRTFEGPSFVTDFLWHNNGLVRVLLVVATIVTALYFTDRQMRWQPASGIRLYQQVCLAVGVAFVVQAFLGYLFTGLIAPRYVMMLGSLLVLIVIPFFRMLYTAVRPSEPPPQVDPHPRF
jgi:hypothetical protein